MIKSITIENYALIDRLELELSPSLNIITGETGAGKSILLGALGLLLGAKADPAAVVDAGRNCVIEGVFDIRDYGLEDIFDEHDLDYDATTVVRRVLTPQGKSRSYVNDLPVQQTMLRELGERLVDIHSQHQSLRLAEEAFRIGILDSVAGHGALAGEYKAKFRALTDSQKRLAALERAAESDRGEREWLEFQAVQLEEAGLADGEQEELEARRGELANAGEIREVLHAASFALADDETGLLPRVRALGGDLGRIADTWAAAVPLAERVHGAFVELKDVEAELAAAAARIESDPAQLAAVEQRLDLVYSLEQKHKVRSVAELIDLMHGYRSRLDAAAGGDEAVMALRDEIVRLDGEATALAAQLTAGRRAAAAQLTAHVEEMLAELGMPSTRFVVDLSPADVLRPSGADNVAFLFSANKNIAPAPVEKIASGGEMSRLMLALKSLAARSRRLPTIVFDEIDSGVSGRIADAMGNIIRELSRHMQVVNITHLPQVAAKGDTHFLVYKDNSGPRSRTGLRLLAPAERVDQIARMLSGNTVTDAALAQAKLLLGDE